jgi:hypothetical protein
MPPPRKQAPRPALRTDPIHSHRWQARWSGLVSPMATVRFKGRIADSVSLHGVLSDSLTRFGTTVKCFLKYFAFFRRKPLTKVWKTGYYRGFPRCFVLSRPLPAASGFRLYSAPTEPPGQGRCISRDRGDISPIQGSCIADTRVSPEGAGLSRLFSFPAMTAVIAGPPKFHPKAV